MTDAPTPQPALPAHGPAPAPLRCPRCSAGIAPEQDWCLQCGAPARTRLAPTPNWRLPIALVAAAVLLAGIALSFAFVKLTEETPAPVTITAPPPGQAAVTTVTPTTAAAPADPNQATVNTVMAPPPVTETHPAATAR